MIGRWMASRGTRDEMIVATKVGEAPGVTDLSARTITAAAEASLRRLQTDRVDLYYIHRDKPSTPLDETLAALDALVRAGKVLHIGASNFTAARLLEALAIADAEGLARFVALQPLYNLLDREFEAELGPVCAREGLACVPYRALAKGFLTGKYRPGAKAVESTHAARALAYLDERGGELLGTLDAIARDHRAPASAVALAWLAAQPTVAAPIASVREPAQLPDLLAMGEVRLTAGELERLSPAGPPPTPPAAAASG